MFIRPASDKVVIDPRTKKKVPSTGLHVPSDVYWHRRLRDGDVLIAEEDTKPAKADKKSQEPKV